ncbi:hypothetical protein LF1_55410 [Rubripirellula obstinata]|uniref:Uncharacterized protein n=1 Tax=Rubripirellula obstinata TaxID=406547 RepID=A0A5B1CAE8_9BACT|nr:hypothetical protein LF1_55410 [Rubripirellula obstinata]
MHRSRACAFSQMEHQPSRPGDAYRYPTGYARCMNPYDPPTSESKPRPIPKRDVPRTTLYSLLIPALVGGTIGSALFASDAGSPGDPNSHGIAFGTYGLLSLLVAISVRWFRQRFHF